MRDNIINITSESVLLNQSLAKFKPPIEKVPDNFELSLESHLPDTSRKGITAGMKLDQMLLSEDSIADWNNFTANHISKSIQ